MIFFDTETTGLIQNAALSLDKQPYIIEIGMVREPEIEGRNKHFHTTLKPPIPLPKIITKITGLTDEDLDDSPVFEDIYIELCEFVDGEKVWAAHNMPFDKGMLEFELRRCFMDKEFPWPDRYIDTVQLAKPHYNGQYKKLLFLYEDLIGPYEQTHRAIDDAEMVMKVYHALMVKG
jgi:DNA polymerase III epsilon subunit family exonuclease